MRAPYSDPPVCVVFICAARRTARDLFVQPGCSVWQTLRLLRRESRKQTSAFREDAHVDVYQETDREQCCRRMGISTAIYRRKRNSRDVFGTPQDGAGKARAADCTRKTEKKFLSRGCNGLRAFDRPHSPCNAQSLSTTPYPTPSCASAPPTCYTSDHRPKKIARPRSSMREICPRPRAMASRNTTAVERPDPSIEGKM